MSSQNNVIIMQSLHQPNMVEVWGTLTELCEYHAELPYHTLKQMKLPFIWKGFRFSKQPYRTVQIDIYGMWRLYGVE